MKIPVRRISGTRVSERQQGYAKAAPSIDTSVITDPITEAVAGFRAQLQDEQRDRQKFEINSRIMNEVNELQADFEVRRRNPEISPLDFAATTNAAYEARHKELTDELYGGGYDKDLVQDLELKLGSIRQTFFAQGLSHQLSALKSRALEQAEDLTKSASQYAAANYEGYGSARDMLLESLKLMPDLTEQEKEDLIDESLGVLRDAGGKALAMQNPKFVIEKLDPQGFTAPAGTAAVAATGSISVEGLDRDRSTVASTLSSGGLSPAVVAGFLGNFDVEAGYGGALGDGGTASGIAQWRKERRDNFKARFGKEPHQATKEEQAQFVLWELQNPNAAGMSQSQVDAIRNASTAEEAARLIDKFYERSDGKHRSRRATSAAQYANLLTVEITPAQEEPVGSSLAPTIPQPKIAGNLPLTVTQQAQNADGTVSTVRTISIGTEKGEVLIPTVIDGKVVTDDEAIQHYKETGENFGTFETKEDATAFAQDLSARHSSGINAQTGNAILDDMNGPERLQVLGWAREQLNKVNASRKAEMDVTIQNITAEALNNGGEIATPLPTQADVLSIYGPVEGPQRWAQIQQSKDTGKAIVTFRTQSAEDIQRGLDAIEPRPGSPTYQTELQIYEAAERAAQHLLGERQNDPAAYAMKYFPSVGQAMKKGTTQYYAEIDRVYRTLGIDSNQAPLLSSDAARQMAQNYKLMSPADKLVFMRENFAGMGEDRFRRFVSNMEGTTAQDDARIFALLKTYQTQQPGEIATLYQQVLEGREIMAQDHARRPSMEEVNKKFRAEGLSAIGNLNADASRAIQETAAALYVVRGGDPKTINTTLYKESLAAALGGSLPMNMTKGAVKDYTILPPKVNKTQFQDWLEDQTFQSITMMSVEKRPPRYGDLKTPVSMSDIIDEGVFVMVSPGRYMIKMASDAGPLMTSTGRPFLVNIRTSDVRNGR